MPALPAGAADAEDAGLGGDDRGRRPRSPRDRRGARPELPSSARARDSAAIRSSTSPGSAPRRSPGPRPREDRQLGRQLDSGGEHHRVAERAGEARLVAVGEDVAADVDEDTRSQPSPAAAVAEPGGDGGGPPVMSTSTVSAPRCSAHAGLGEAAPERGGGVAVRRAPPRRQRPPADDLGQRARPGWGRSASRSQATPPSTNAVPNDSHAGRSRGRRPRHRPRPCRGPARFEAAGERPARARSRELSRSGERRLGVAQRDAISSRGAIELLVGHHRRALERQVAIDLDPGAAAVVLVADPDGDRARNPVDPQQEHV